MKTRTFLAVLGFVIPSACAHPPHSVRIRTPGATDDRQYNAQSKNWESRDEASGIEATRRYSRLDH